MITADYFDKHLKKHEKLTVYSADNVPHAIVKRYHITTESNRNTYFDLDCADLKKLCDMMGLTLNPNK